MPAAALDGDGVAYEFHRYDGVGHGFQDFNDPDRYRVGPTADAWEKIFGFFDARLS